MVTGRLSRDSTFMNLDFYLLLINLNVACHMAAKYHSRHTEPVMPDDGI